MKLGVHIGYWGLGLTREDQLAIVQEAERLGYDSVWTAEAYGSDAATILGWIAGQTTTIRIGSAIFQMPGRSPGDDGDDGRDARPALRRADAPRASAPRGRRWPRAGTAQRFARQIQRTREYVAVVRQALARERLEFHGETLELPLPDGPGKALKLTIAPVQERDPDLPGGDRAQQHARWPARSPTAGSRRCSPPSTSPSSGRCSRRARRAPGASLDGFDIAPTVQVFVTDDLAGARDAMRPFIALYVGGMGSREQNFYNQLVQRYGFEDAAREVQDLYLDGKREEAMAALPGRAHRPGVARGPARPRARAPGASTATPASGRWASRRWRGTRTGASSSCGSSRSLPPPDRRLRLLLGAFGDPGHAFPLIALGGALVGARPRGRPADVVALGARTSSAAGMALRGRAGVPRLPHARAPAEALRGGRAGDRARRARWWPRCAPTPWWPTSSRWRRRWPPSSRACRWRRSSRTSIRARRRAGRRTRSGRGCRARRVGRRVWGALSRVTDAGLEHGRRELNETRRRLGLGPLRARARRDLAGAGAGGDLPAARVPARGGAARARTSSARCCGSRPRRTSSCRRATRRSCSSRPRPRRTRRTSCCARRCAGSPTRPCACSPSWNRRPLTEPVDVPANARLVDWVSYARTMPRCDVVVCHGGHGTLARALASGCAVVVVPAAGDMNENAARVDWAGVGVRVPRRLCAPRPVRLAVERALAEPRLRERRPRARGVVARRTIPRRARPSSSRRSPPERRRRRVGRRATVRRWIASAHEATLRSGHRRGRARRLRCSCGPRPPPARRCRRARRRRRSRVKLTTTEERELAAPLVATHDVERGRRVHGLDAERDLRAAARREGGGHGQVGNRLHRPDRRERPHHRVVASGDRSLGPPRATRATR